MAREKQDIGFLHGLRAFAAFWVLSAHCVIWGGGPTSHLPDPKLAVDLFMILSGFLMVHSMQGDDASHRWLRFYTRRYFRIAPGYYIALIAALTVPFFLPGFDVLYHLPRSTPMPWYYDPQIAHFSIAKLVSHLTFVFGLIPSHTASTWLPDWSLSLEMQFYLVFPLLYLFMKRFGAAWITVVALLMFAAIHLLLKPFGGPYFGHAFPELAPLPYKIMYFVAGMLLYEYAFDKTLTSANRLWMLAFAALLLVSEVRFIRFNVAYELLFLVVFWICLSPTTKDSAFATRLRSLLGSPLGRFGSDASYSVYLCHGFFIAGCGAFLFTWPEFLALPVALRIAVVWVITVTGTYALATVIYHYVERPGIKLGARVVMPLKNGPLKLRLFRSK